MRIKSVEVIEDGLDYVDISVAGTNNFQLYNGPIVHNCGTGAGFSVERQFVAEMPTVGKSLSRSIYKKNNKNYPKIPKEDLSSYDKKSNTIIVADSKEGWASALRIFIVEMYNGNFKVSVDVSGVRAAGLPLKVFGGRSSGSSALVEMLEKVRAIFIDANGRKLTSVEAHDIMCHIAASVVVGGVRRASLISLSNLSDERMRYAKMGDWWVENSQRSLANNSVAYTEKPEIGQFMREWQSLYESKAGERGVFNRAAAKRVAAATGRDPNHDFMPNPCCFAGDMRLLTSEGYKSFAELEGQNFAIVSESGVTSPGKVWSVGVKPVVEVHFLGDKRSIVCTEDHIFKLFDGCEAAAKNLAGIRLRAHENPDGVVVSDVIPCGEAEVFDFNEPHEHWGVVEGVVAHNCEISLRDAQFCNLTSIVVRAEDSLEDLTMKAKAATLLGTMQATLTDFSYLSPVWKENCEAERLLGVSMSGLMDHPILSKVSDEAKQWFEVLAATVAEENKKWAKQFNINPAAAARCVKPEGTCSQLNDTSSGLHPRYAPYYIRRVRADEKDPLAVVMEQQGYPCEPDVMQKSTKVFSFPVRAPETAVFRDDRTALEQLEYWMMIKKHWCDSHNPSVTIYVKEHEWLEVGSWVYKNFDDICGLSFLPHSNHVYKQAPYEACTKEQYEALLAKMPKGIDYEALSRLETTDQTTGVQEYSCSAGVCDLV